MMYQGLQLRTHQKNQCPLVVGLPVTTIISWISLVLNMKIVFEFHGGVKGGVKPCKTI